MRHRLAGAIAVGCLALAFAPSARADDTIKRPGDHPDYVVELEPHGDLGFGFRYDGVGVGVGFRASIVVVKNGFIPKLNNSVAVTFGGDFIHYGGCYFSNIDCNANYLFFPAGLQWNFFVAEHWSVFGEPAIVPFYGFYDDYCAVNGKFRYCSDPAHFSVTPGFYVGGRYHFNEHIALTMRIGYPTFSVGASFM